MTGRIASLLNRRLASAFVLNGHRPQLGVVLPAARPDLADFQCNGALAACTGKEAALLAEAVASAVRGLEGIASAEAAGPGFINIRVSDDMLSRRVDAIRTDPRAGGGAPAHPAQKILIDFGGANVAKPMHVGHLRSLIVGDCLQRLFRFLGHDVVSDIHLGDWGLQMGVLLAELALSYPDAHARSEVIPVSIDDLDSLYPRASAHSRDDPAFLDSARKATFALQDGAPWHRAQWRHFIEVTREALERDLDPLGVHFDLWKGESDAAEAIPGLIADLRARGIAVEDNGALVVHVAREDDRKKYPPVILVNSNGAVGYLATDLATLVLRERDNAPDQCIYVVDQRQSLHFEQLFRAADLAGLMPSNKMEHVGFGTVNGKDGKPYKTRQGGALKLKDLLDMARRAAAERLAADNEAPQQAETDKIALAAIKFADLSNARTTNYVFDLERFMASEGRTGPYLLYAAVRIGSLLRKAAADNAVAGPARIATLPERALALHLDGFESALHAAAAKRAPHLLCEHAYGLAQAFASVYAACPILTAAPDIRASRLALAEATLAQLGIALDIMGLDIPGYM